MLISKDATIREIHHRVKNNLQTISSLLRLQARRLENPRGQGGGVRVGAADPHDRPRPRVAVAGARHDVTFIEIVRPLLRLAEESLHRPTVLCTSALGDGGRIPARVATPLSVVLTELMQNAVDHGFPEGSGGGKVVVMLDNDHERLRIEVDRRRPGLDPGFDLDAATGLGLSIVRTLVTTELNGQIAMRPATADGPRGCRSQRPRRRPRHGDRARPCPSRVIELRRRPLSRWVSRLSVRHLTATSAPTSILGRVLPAVVLALWSVP